MALFVKSFGTKYGDNLDDIDKKRNQITCLYPGERHHAIVFMVDTSGSMLEEDAIEKLNIGFRLFKEQIVNDSVNDPFFQYCIDVAIISFGPDVRVQQPFTAVSEMVPPTLTANGGTPMGAAIDKALDMIAEQKARYNELGTPYYRPWIFCITDGGPNDSYATAAQRLKEMEDATKVLGYCVGVANFDRRTMASIFNTERIFELENLNFPALFKIIIDCIRGVYCAYPADRFNAIDVPSCLHKLDDLDDIWRY